MQYFQGTMKQKKDENEINATESNAINKQQSESLKSTTIMQIQSQVKTTD